MKKLTSTELTDELYSDIFPDPNNDITAFVPVMRGCDNYCSYCIVPYVRGRARSRPQKDILKEVELLLAKDIKEITLLGQSVNEYSYDGVTFPELLKLVDGVESPRLGGAPTDRLPRIKFTTSHPKNMSHELVQAIRDAPGVCEWIHLPVQSGSNRILKAMKRQYTREDYLGWIEELRKAIPGIAITTDVMAGFPGETEKDFDESLELVKLVRFDSAYMFKYSERPGTKACDMKPEVPEEIRRSRLSELIEVQNQITRERNHELVGTTQEVLILGKGKRDVPGSDQSEVNSWYGKTRQHKTVAVNGDMRVGDLVQVKIEGIRGWTAWGKHGSM